MDEFGISLIINPCMFISSIALSEKLDRNWWFRCIDCDSSAVVFSNTSFVLFQSLNTGHTVFSMFALPILIPQVLYICHFVSSTLIISLFAILDIR